MAIYIGLIRIANAMGFRDGRWPIRNMIKYGFPIYRMGKGRKWRTDDDLIKMWKLKKCQIERELYLNKKEQRKQKKLAKQAEMNSSANLNDNSIPDPGIYTPENVDNLFITEISDNPGIADTHKD